MIEDDFFATIKFKSGEEIFCKVASSDEEDRLMLLVSNPVIIAEIKGRTGVVGYKVEPWLKTTKDDMFIINMDKVITLSESTDLEIISVYQQFVQDMARSKSGVPKLSRRMGYVSSVNDAKDILEKIYKKKGS